MELTSRQRAYLSGEANSLEAIFQVGKSGVTPELVRAVDDALEKRELIKLSVLKNCADDPREIGEMVAERTRGTLVRVIGKKIILFRQARENTKFPLPR